MTESIILVYDDHNLTSDIQHFFKNDETLMKFTMFYETTGDILQTYFETYFMPRHRTVARICGNNAKLYEKSAYQSLTQHHTLRWS